MIVQIYNYFLNHQIFLPRGGTKGIHEGTQRKKGNRGIPAGLKITTSVNLFNELHQFHEAGFSFRLRRKEKLWEHTGEKKAENGFLPGRRRRKNKN